MTDVQIIPYVNTYREQVIALVLNIQQNEFQVPVTLADQPDLSDIPAYCQVKNGNFWIAIIGVQLFRLMIDAKILKGFVYIHTQTIA